MGGQSALASAFEEEVVADCHVEDVEPPGELQGLEVRIGGKVQVQQDQGQRQVQEEG